MKIKKNIKYVRNNYGPNYSGPNSLSSMNLYFFWLVWTLVWFIVDLTAINQPKLTPKYRLAINVGFIVKELRSGDTLLTSI